MSFGIADVMHEIKNGEMTYYASCPFCGWKSIRYCSFILAAYFASTHACRK